MGLSVIRAAVSDIFRTRRDSFSYSRLIAACGRQVTLLKQ